MKAIILAGGEGTRLRPITYEIPKPLIPVKKKPVIDHAIDFLARHGFSDIGAIISTKHRSDFERWQSARSGAGTVKLILEEKPAGTFGCLRLAKDWLRGESFALVNGDCLVDCKFDRVKKFHEMHRPVVTAPLLSMHTSGNYSVCTLDGLCVSEITRKDVAAGTQLNCGGPYLIEPTIFKYDDPQRDFLNIEADIFPRLIAEKQLFAIVDRESRFYDCGTLQSWEKAIKEW